MEREKESGEVILLDEAGEPVAFSHVLTFVYEGEKYVALEPADEVDGEEAEIELLRIEQKDGETVYCTIDNEILREEVFTEFLDVMDEMEESGNE